jgi:hypothetical protein
MRIPPWAACSRSGTMRSMVGSVSMLSLCPHMLTRRRGKACHLMLAARRTLRSAQSLALQITSRRGGHGIDRLRLETAFRSRGRLVSFPPWS